MRDKILVFPGSFNPFHEGHLELIERISKRYLIIILISNNPNKERVSFQHRFNQITNFFSSKKKQNTNILIGINFGLTTDFLKSINSNMILRGFRNKVDKKYEKELIKEYKTTKKNLKIRLLRSKNNKRISSTYLRDNN